MTLDDQPVRQPTPPARNAERCPHCGVKVLPKHKGSHMRRVHPEIPHEANRPIPEGLEACPECGAPVRPDRMTAHMNKAHSPEALVRARERESLVQARAKEVRKKSSSKTGVESPDQMSVSAQIKAGLRPKTNKAVRCSECHCRVVHVGSKTFDVDPNGYILWTHACDGEARGQSIRAYSGGAVESNRRKH